MKEYLFTTSLETRDYECDLQGVVNNANYQHYLEYTRHKWLQSRGQSFQQWHDKGIDAGARFIFEQDIYRKADMKLCIQATVTIVSVVNGRLSKGDEIAFLLEDAK